MDIKNVDFWEITEALGRNRMKQLYTKYSLHWDKFKILQLL